MKKTGIISQARMTSTRLPGKILKQANGKPMLEYHINRLRWSELPIYIATTVNDTDEPVVAFAESQGLKYYRGSEDNVLSRYYECAKENNLDIVIRVTSDCPLIDGKQVREGLETYLAHNDENLYLSNSLERTFARGFDYEIFSFKLLEEAYYHADQDFEKEHVTPYINRNRSGNVKLINLAAPQNHGNLRITLDTPEDYELLRILIEDYNADTLNWHQITALLLAHPELVKINEHIEQKKV